MPSAPRELWTPPPAGGSKPPSGPLRVLLAWSPVVLALIVLGQVGALGLRRAMAESARLEEAEKQMRARLEREEQEAQSLERVERAQNDPVYLERERRVLRAESTPAAGDDGAER